MNGLLRDRDARIKAQKAEEAKQRAEQMAARAKRQRESSKS